ncbi:MAG TPA: electron transfer flavoprotein subunit alpha/FixB family protein, partial [Mycobacterium sp.]
MAEVLVLITGDGASITKSSLELLTMARRIGEPSAVVFGSEVDTEVLSRYGGATVYLFEGTEYADFLVAPKADALAALVADRKPAAVLMTSTAEGKEIGARVALRSGAGFVYDAVDVFAGEQGPTTVQSVFAGNFTVTSSFAQQSGAVIAVKPNATTPTEVSDPAAGVVQVVPHTVAESAKGARVTA